MDGADQSGGRQVGTEHTLLLAAEDEFLDSLGGGLVQLTDASGGEDSSGRGDQCRRLRDEGPAGFEQPGQGGAGVSRQVEGRQCRLAGPQCVDESGFDQVRTGRKCP